MELIFLRPITYNILKMAELLSLQRVSYAWRDALSSQFNLLLTLYNFTASIS